MGRRTFARNRDVVLPAAWGSLRRAWRDPGAFREQVLREVWTIGKRFGAAPVENVDRWDLRCLWYYTVLEGPIDDPHRLLLAAMAKGLDARSFFEIGTNRGWTAWTVAHNNPALEVVTLDVPPAAAPPDLELPLGSDDRHFLIDDDACGEAFRGTPEAARITQLRGDSATFDFAPYRGRFDLVYVDGAHTYEYVTSDTAHALELIGDRGTVAWDDYTTNPGVWRAVRETALRLERPVYHVLGTRMAIFSRREDFVVRRARDVHASVPGL